MLVGSLGDATPLREEGLSTPEDACHAVCPICLLPPLCPSRLKCFPCSSVDVSLTLPSSAASENAQSSTNTTSDARASMVPCGAFTRLCLFCAIQYLRLDMEPSSREIRVKCLFCPSKVTLLKTTSIFDVVDIDYSLFFVPISEARTCPLCHESMALENKPHAQALAHVAKWCPQYMQRCMCGTFLTRQQMQEHLRNCQVYQICPMCHGFVCKADMTSHMSTIHRSKPCLYCNEYFPEETILRHVMIGCPSRQCSCPICGDGHSREGILEHIQTEHFPTLTHPRLPF